MLFRSFYDFDDSQIWKPSFRVSWEGQWQAGEYKAHSMVGDQGWTMISNKTTSERAAPQPSGQSAWALPDSPVWTEATTAPLAVQGLRFTIGDILTTVDGFRFFRAQNTGAEEYAYIIRDLTDEYNPTLLASGNLPSGPQGWLEIGIPGSFFFPGQVVDVMFITQVVTSANQWAHNWTLQDENFGTPIGGQYTNDKNGGYSALRINVIDGGLNDVKSDLDQLKAGDDLVFTEANDSGRFNIYQVVVTPAY